MASYRAEASRHLLRDGDLGEPVKVLIAGTSVTAVPAALLVESPGTSPILWALLFVPAALAGYRFREKGIAAAAALGLVSLAVVALRPYASPAIILPFVAMIALASLASTLGYSVERDQVRRREAVEQAPGGAFLLNRREAAIEGANRTFAELLGYSAEDLEGLPVSKVWPHAEDRARFIALAEPGGETATVETRFVGRDDAEHWLVLSGRCLDDRSLLCRVEDVTRYRKAEEDLNARCSRLTAVLDALPAYVTLQREDHTYRFVNRAFRETFGDPDGRPCYQVLRGSRRPCSPCRGTLVFGLRSPQHWEWDHVNGKTYEVHAYPFSDTDGSPLMLQLGVEITQRVQAEEALKGFAGSLQAKNRELEVLKSQLCVVNDDLDAMVRERTADVEKLLTQKDEFISQLGHDLKTPLTPLVALMPGILDREQDPELRRLLEIAGHNVTYMKDLVQKTLQLARLNSLYIELDLEPLDLRAELNNTLRTYAVQSRTKAIAVNNNVPPGLTVRADRVLLGEVFNNLIANAIKCVQNETGTVTIDAIRDRGTAVVSVRDNGIGMTREQLDQAFAAFYKADPSRHDLESPGLGLTICRRIVVRHGGRIWAESAGEGTGSTIIFTLEAIDEA